MCETNVSLWDCFSNLPAGYMLRGLGGGGAGGSVHFALRLFYAQAL